MDVNELVAKLRGLGIRQEGDPVLRQQCQPFDLPTERSQALALWNQLRRYVDKLQRIYPFSKGVGLAAPRSASPAPCPSSAHPTAPTTSPSSTQ